MPEGVGYSGSNVVASTGPDLNYVGNFCYAQSGEVVLNNSTNTHFDFTTGNHVIEGHYQITFDITNMGANKITGFNISYNGIVVAEMRVYNNSAYGMLDLDTPIYLLIPPYTNVKIEGITTNTSNIPSFGLFSGKVHS
jgi:hypothetical protein